jgi:hypothetical protein
VSLDGDDIVLSTFKDSNCQTKRSTKKFTLGQEVEGVTFSLPSDGTPITMSSQIICCSDEIVLEILLRV